MQEIQRLLQMGENGGPELDSDLSDSDDEKKEKTITTDTGVAEADATEVPAHAHASRPGGNAGVSESAYTSRQ